MHYKLEDKESHTDTCAGCLAVTTADLSVHSMRTNISMAKEENNPFRGSKLGIRDSLRIHNAKTI